ncbi:MDR family MFS transporter [Vulgatibacter sp.]|uniref:MDR family MFS transporter n=1 Tax=Vulgatibacter sp. TaxID=1971226 RepID=UPI003567D555
MKKTHRPLTLTALMLSMFLAAMEMTVVSTAMPTVVGDLGGIHLYAWVFTAYLLASTVMVPIFGKLADLYGRKPILLFGLAVFLAGSVASGLSATMLQLVFFRALQGFGAGAVQPIVLTVIGDIYSLEERAKVQGAIGAIWGFAGLVGPLLGGFIVKWLSWHWIFLLNVPFGLLSMGLIFFFLHESVERRAHRLDYGGAALLGAGIFALLAATSAGIGPWPLAAAVVLLAAFAWVESRAKEPILPLDLLRDRVIGLSSLAGALIGAAMMATVTYVPLFVQSVLGGSAADAGRAITPMVIGWPIASTLSGKLIPSIGFRPMIRLGLALTAASAIAVALVVDPGVPLWLVGTLMFFFGTGMGLANTALLLAVQTAVSWQRRGVATASTMFFRTIGGALSVGALGGIIAASLAAQPGVPPGAADQLLGPEHGASLPASLLRSLSGALAAGLHTSFVVIACLAALALAVGLLFPRPVAPDQAAEPG